MKQEISAGGIVFKKVPSTSSCTRRCGTSLRTSSDKILWLIVQHSQHKGWVFPKGLTSDHDGEKDLKETALREVHEEGGILAKIVSDRTFENEYIYTFDHQKIKKKVYYFLMEYVSGCEKDHDHEVSEALWLPETEALNKLTFKNDKINFEEAVKTLNLKS